MNNTAIAILWFIWFSLFCLGTLKNTYLISYTSRGRDEENVAIDILEGPDNRVVYAERKQSFAEYVGKFQEYTSVVACIWRLDDKVKSLYLKFDASSNAGINSMSFQKQFANNQNYNSIKDRFETLFDSIGKVSASIFDKDEYNKDLMKSKFILLKNLV